VQTGNISYNLHRSNDDPDVWILYENWKAPSDLAAHFQLSYMKASLAVLPAVLESEMDLRHCSMVTKIARK
jgi:quinol monooxygenase YgiN